MKPLLISSGGGHVTTEKKQTITNSVRVTVGVCVVFLFVSLGHCLSHAVEPKRHRCHHYTIQQNWRIVKYFWNRKFLVYHKVFEQSQRDEDNDETMCLVMVIPYCTLTFRCLSPGAKLSAPCSFVTNNCVWWLAFVCHCVTIHSGAPHYLPKINNHPILWNWSKTTFHSFKRGERIWQFTWYAWFYCTYLFIYLSYLSMLRFKQDN